MKGCKLEAIYHLPYVLEELYILGYYGISNGDAS